MNSQVLFEKVGRVGIITLNRPEKLNAFAGRMREDIARTMAQASSDDQVRVLVLTGAGRAFSAGADIAYMRDLIEHQDWDAAAALVEAGAKVVTVLSTIDKPVIGAINGAAAGGGANLALACDIRIAGERASIGQTFSRIGLHPDWGGTYFLPRLVGPAKALELIFTAEMVNAPEALRLGLFNQVVPDAELMTTTLDFAERLAGKPPLALAAAKRAIRDSHRATLAEMLASELMNQVRLFKTEDVREGVAAFLEKRSPEYRGV